MRYDGKYDWADGETLDTFAVYAVIRSAYLVPKLSVFDPAMIRVTLPFHLRTLSGVDGEVRLELDDSRAPTQRTVLDALEEKYPMLRGTIRDHQTKERRAFLRYFACQQDLSLESPDAPLPEAVAKGEEPFMIVGAIAGG